MKYFLSLFAALFISCNTYGQLTLSDSIHCTSDVLHAGVTGGIIPISSGITADDNWSSVIPIGFTFDFYGVANTSCIIGSNGCLGFDLANALAYNTWPIGNTLLGSTAAAPDVVDCICGPWCDVYIPAGGTIDYSIQGVAPNRNFAVTWCGTAMYSCTTQWLTTQIILYESTNIVEVHIGHHTFCTSWNGGYAIVGVKNLAGTLATVAPGRDYPANWTATDEAWRFTPGAGTYTVSSIPYAPIPYASSVVYWYDSTTGAYIDSGATITVTPSVPTTYEAAVLGCQDTIKSYILVVPPGIGVGGGNIPHIDTYSYINPSMCGVCNGSITLNGINPLQIDTVFYAFNGVAQPTFVSSAGPDSTITLGPLCEGVYNYVYVKVGTCPSNAVGPITLTGPHLAITADTFTNPTSCITYDGSINFRGLPPGDTVFVTYTYDGASVGPVARYPDIDSDITFTGLPSGAYDNFMFKDDSCFFGPYNINLVAPPIIISHETFVDPTVCGSSNGSFTLYGLLPGEPVTVTYNAAYSFPAHTAAVTYTGTVGADSTVTITGLPAGIYSSIVANIGSCSANGTPITITNPAPIPAAFYPVEINHCGEDEVIVVNTSTPEPDYTAYFNFGDLTPIDSSNAIPLPHFYDDASTGHSAVYNIILTYEGYNNPACLSTYTQTVTFNHPLASSFTTNADTICLGDAIQFTANVNIDSPVYTWNFNDGTPPVVSTSIYASHTYPAGGIFTPTLTVTDSIGCDSSVSPYNVHVITISVRTRVQDTTVCLVDSMPLIATGVVDFPGIGWNYSWTPTNNIGIDSTYTIPGPATTSTSITNFFGVGTYTYKVLATTTFPALVLDANGCADSFYETIISNPPVTLTNVTASPQTIMYGSSIYLNASGALYYVWTPDNGTLNNANINNPLATPTDSTTIYTVYGMNEYGCRDSATVTVRLDNTTYQGAPSAFTPNGDGLNDVFKITPLSYQKLVEMRVYNRWGQPVFYSNNAENGWDGTFNGVPQDMGVYSYEIILALPSGNNQVYKGTITLIR